MSDDNPNQEENTEKKEKHPGQAPNCLKCAYFKVSWDTFFPRSCIIFGFKTNNMPSIEVFRATGRICPSFKLKEGLK